MLALFRHPTYRLLFAAQVVALAGTGLATVALGLLAYQLAGDQAGAVLGTALAIKMVAYVGVSPLARALLESYPSRTVLIGLDLVRAGLAASLLFVTEIWQIYLLIFLLQSASAAFTPTFQAVIPEILPDEGEYTRALSLSRLAYDLESLASPVLAAALLTLVPFHALFAGTAFGFVASALLIMACTFPAMAHRQDNGAFWSRVGSGWRIFLATPRLRGLLALNLTISAVGSLVIVNTVVFVRDSFGRADDDVAIAFAAFGAGSMASALALPGLLDRIRDRSVMISAGVLALVAMTLFAALWSSSLVPWPAFLIFWFGFGLAYSAVLTPSARLLRRSAAPEDRPAIFAAQFALSHACWLVAYPLAGYAGAHIGLAAAAFALVGLGTLGLIAALRFWPAGSQSALPHVHDDLPPDHPHLHGAEKTEAGYRHTHVFLIDSLHRQWPTQG